MADHRKREIDDTDFKLLAQIVPKDTICASNLKCGLVVSILVSGTRVQTRPKPLDFYGRKNLQHAFLRRG
jgi:hypothetical protein